MKISLNLHRKRPSTHLKRLLPIVRASFTLLLFGGWPSVVASTQEAITEASEAARLVSDFLRESGQDGIAIEALLRDLHAANPEALAELESRLTMADRIEEAVAVRAMRDRLLSGEIALRPQHSNLVLIPGGRFIMGDDSQDAPRVEVAVTTFEIAAHPVTGELWEFVRSWAANNNYRGLPSGSAKAPDHPVVGIQWWDAVNWCNARSEMEGLEPVYQLPGGGVFRDRRNPVPEVNWQADGFRLPTEAEWELAARGGLTGREFPWGDEICFADANFYSSGSCLLNTNGRHGYHPHFSSDGWPYTSPVGSFPPNGFGLFDMAGNVWEWCWNCYSPNSYAEYSQDAREGNTDWSLSSGSMLLDDPFQRQFRHLSLGDSPITHRGVLRVIRGGAWSQGAADARVAARSYSPPGLHGNALGFRVARSLPSCGREMVAPALARTPSHLTSFDPNSLPHGVSQLIRTYEASRASALKPIADLEASYRDFLLQIWREADGDTNFQELISDEMAALTDGIDRRTPVPQESRLFRGRSGFLRQKVRLCAELGPGLTQMLENCGTRLLLLAQRLEDTGLPEPALAVRREYWRLSGDPDAESRRIRPAFVTIPSGSFLMGHTGFDLSRGGVSHRTPNSVSVAQYQIAVHQVTKELWDEVRQWASSVPGYAELQEGIAKAPNHPVVGIEWWDAILWCNALSEQEGLEPVYRHANGSVWRVKVEGKAPAAYLSKRREEYSDEDFRLQPVINWNASGFRLPSGAEWEKAARGGLIGKPYPTGDTISQLDANIHSPDRFDGLHPDWGFGKLPLTSPVGAFPANGFGIFDVAGIPGEFCWGPYSNTTLHGDRRSWGPNKVSGPNGRIGISAPGVSLNASYETGFRLVRRGVR